MNPRPRLITAFSDARPFSAASNALQYRHPQRRTLWAWLWGRV